jgi:hypothetical protein
MAREWKARSAPRPTSITEIARRYHAAAVALAQTLGLSLPETLAAHRESITAIFIEASRCELRLPAGVKLPPLGMTGVETARGQSPHEPVIEDMTAVIPSNGQGTGAAAEGSAPPARPEIVPREGPPVPDLPTVVPTGCPCAGQAISALKPASLSMLLAKTANKVHEEGDGWVPLLGALQRERAARIAHVRKPALAPVEEDGHG